MKKKYLILSCVSVLIFAQAAQSQIQCFEFGYGITNTLSVPVGKLIRIHSLIGCSATSFSDINNYQTRDPASQAVSQAQRGVTIRLESGREINLSPYTVSIGGASGYFGVTSLSSVNAATPSSPLLIPGPFTIQKNGDTSTLLVYEIMDNLGSSSAAQTPSQGSSVVVPTSAAGDVDVKMEQSADNVTWTECLPGTYNSSTVKRFFRLRAIEK
jgi:hypothetical protein